MTDELTNQNKFSDLKKDTIVIIPAYNEQASLSLVLSDIPKQRVIKIIVVDNNSTDKTATVAKENGAEVVFEKQMGYGKACLTGIEKALEDSPKNIIFIDADYSDDPKEMPLIFEKLDDGYELVIGSRTLGKAMPGALLPQARFGNWLSTFLLKILYPGTSFSDLGPFRGIKTESLIKMNMRDEDFGWTVEMQVKALIQALKCCEVSVSYKKRIGVSKITGTLKGTILAGHKILYTIFKYWLLSKLKIRDKEEKAL